MSNHIFFRRISVDRMYGQKFRHLELTHLSKRINIVHGANASGKSTIAHAVQSVLLPAYRKGGRATLDANLHIGPGELEVRVRGSRRECRLGGKLFEWNPELIRPESYHISLHDLLSADSGDQSFAEEIMKEASGGFDVQAAGDRLAFAIPKMLTAHHNTAKAVKQQQRKLRDVRAEHRGLARERIRLSELRSDLQSASEAQRRIVQLQKALAYHREKERSEAAHRSLLLFPAILQTAAGRNIGNVSARLRERTEDVTRTGAERDRLRRQVSDVRQSIARSTLPRPGLPAGFLARLSARIQDLKDTEARIDRIAERLAGERGSAQAILDSIAEAEGRDPSVTLGIEFIERLSPQVRRLADVTGRKSAQEALEQILRVNGHEDLEQRDEALRQAQQYLRDWLSEKTPDGDGNGRIRLLLWITLALSGVGAFLVALDNPVGWAGLLVTALILGALYLLPSAPEPGDPREVHQRGFQKLGIEDPSSWNPETVAAHLDSLLKRHAAIKVDQEKHNRWQAHAKERESLDAEWDALTRRISTLEQEAGLKADSAESLFLLASRILDFQRDTDKADHSQAQLRQAEQTRERHLARINELLAKQGSGAADNAARATAALERLRTVNEQLQREIQLCKTLESKLDEVVRQHTRAIGRRRKVFTELALTDGDMEALHRLAGQAKAYRRAKEDADKASAVLDTRILELEAVANDAKVLKSVATDALDDELTRLESTAARRDKLQQEITAIETRIQDTEKGHALEEALTAYDRSRTALEADREENCRKTIGGVLVRALLDYTREQGLPPVFQHAKETFYAVTGGRYELRMSDRSEFRAFDTYLEREHGLDELSSGTRVQLLLCVRVAFVESQERDNRFPLTLDETLANSDDSRAETVIRTIAALAGRRQVIYFTAQEDEVRKWETLAAGIPVRVVRLRG